MAETYSVSTDLLQNKNETKVLELHLVDGMWVLLHDFTGVLKKGKFLADTAIRKNGPVKADTQILQAVQHQMRKATKNVQ